MPFDKFVDMQSVNEARRKAIQGSLETMSLVDLHQLVKELSDFEGDPNRKNLVSAIEAHPEASFYRAVTQEGAIIFYCPGDDTGVWFLPGSGMGPLPEEAKRHMREAMAAPSRKPTGHQADMGETTQRAHNTAQSIETTREHYRSPSGAEKHHLQSAETRGVNN